MKIKLISPRMSLRPMDSEYKRLLSPSLSLLTLAALTPQEHTVYIEDENADRVNLNDRPDLVGITVNVDTSARAYEISTQYRKKGIPVIAGGIHVSANPDEALNYVDAVCIGEAEEIWENILLDLTKGKLKKKYYHDKPADPAKIPIPRWELIDKSKYLYTNILCASRGCPYQCEFCYNSCSYVHNCYRNRPIHHVLQEIEALGTRHVMFIDDNLIGNIGWAREFFRAIKPLGLKWNAAVSANLVHYPDLLDGMKESGCQSLFIGFESINKESVEKVNKKQNNVDLYETLIEEIHARGIMVNASLVFGFDSDRPGIFQDTLEWLVRNKIETMTAHILTPYPGTILYDRLQREDRLIDSVPEHYNTSHVVFKPKHMTPEELYHGYLWIYKEFYSLKNIIRRIPSKADQRIPYLLFNLGYRKFGSITSKIGGLGFMGVLGKLARRLSYGID